MVGIIPIHFLSVEHLKLQKKYGKDRGRKIGEIYSLISGWGFFLFWAGLWFSSQPRFIVPIFSALAVTVPVVSFMIPVLHLMIFLPFFLVGAWLGIEGVKETTLRVAETHRAERIITSGVYSFVRHPQYLGGLLVHVGVSLLLSAWYSLLSAPTMAMLVYLISRKEEEELIKEFGKEYEDYGKEVPMFIPRLGRWRVQSSF
ncbi:MAG: isoprenylcysteine carboxylmethyltransferase family protein [Candidatus Bathyarchaeia archaeon]